MVWVCPFGRLIGIPCSTSGMVMMKVISSRNVRSMSGVILTSLICVIGLMVVRRAMRVITRG